MGSTMGDHPGSSPDRIGGIPIKEEEADYNQVSGPSFGGLDLASLQGHDEDDITKLLKGEGVSKMPNLGGFEDKVIDQTEKAADAIDFEDMSDDDLASDDDDSAAAATGQDDGINHDTGDLEDLFGGGPESGIDLPPFPLPGGNAEAEQLTGLTFPTEAPVIRDRDVTDEAWNTMSFEERQRLNFPQYDVNIHKWISQTNEENTTIQKTPESVDELFAQRFPSFQQHKIMYFNELFAEWPAEYVYKEPARDPAPLIPTKLELEIDADHSKLFRIPDSGLTSQSANYGDDGDWGLDAADSSSNHSGSEPSLVGGFSLDEITTLCDDWGSSFALPGSSTSTAPVAIVKDEEMDDWDREFLQPQAKPRFVPGLPRISTYDTRGIEDFQRETRLAGRRVRLDYDDPYLLINKEGEKERPAKRPRFEDKTKRMANGQLRRDVFHHFNLSNDSAYEALKANHKSKVRATLSNLSVEHSLPALKLAFPFYRTKITGQPWAHHRKKLELEKVVKHAIGVRKPSKVRRKDTKGRSNQEIFKTTKDLSLNDNSTAVLFEYSEEFPTMLSNFGMASRVINYHRRKNRNDEDKIPKLDIGEGHLLLPEDRSPFSIFGTVDPGETVPTLHNEMYRAPIFKHDARPNDFLLGLTTSTTEGPRLYLRNIDHVYVVGQTLPSLEVPGPHARKVTNTSKNRLKMISYRMMKRSETQDILLPELTPHVFEKQDPQNRQKMKEFLYYDRDTRTWTLPEGQTLMDESAIRSMIKPEDACLIEAMQVGQQMLSNAGYDSKDKGEEDDEGAEEPLIAKMAPWELTKNFIDASAGKAMVALHGEGDPTGHGLGFSFIKTSMKGGYINAVQGPLATSADAIERERKANGGHSYNVKKQQDMYNAAIRQIWQRQKATLSDPTRHDDADVLDTANEDDRFNSGQADTTPAPLDDGRSQFSRLSGASRSGKKKLKIERKKWNDAGEIVTETVILDDPVVIRQYLKRRRENEEQSGERDVYSLQPAADADTIRRQQKLVDEELDRLIRNQGRRRGRESKSKGKKQDANPDASSGVLPGDKASAGTTRKCANCGQVGHIKTNKIKCPLLNGTISQSTNGADHGGFGSFGAPSAGPSSANE
ncbi:hypothetical protein F4677DRAFT_422775 [Hypoxylon crocopeplum]|nr:hypothetical protein F4677DRAFT_422775 [Hypoxylon crocopeplum]